MENLGSTRYIYKLASQAEWTQACEDLMWQGSEVDRRDGFIHFSSAGQVPETARKYFHDVEHLLLLSFDPTAFGAHLKYEPARNGELFPHLYCPLDTRLLVEMQRLSLASL
jgi:uncharacterized protein (DUF952 family)